MLADNKFTVLLSQGLFDKLVLVSLEIFVRLLEEETFLSQCHMVGGDTDVRTCNNCHVPVMLQCFYRVMRSWIL